MVDIVFFGIGISIILIFLMSLVIYISDVITDFKQIILHTFCLLICLFIIFILLFIGIYMGYININII